MNRECPNGHTIFKRYGSFENVNGIVQRYRCSVCGKLFSDNPGNMNRLRQPLYNAAVSLLKSGDSTREVERKIGIAKETAMRIQRRIFRPQPKVRRTPPPSEKKRRYLKTYFKRIKGRNGYRRLAWQRNCREWAAWILVKSNRPMTIDELYSEVLKKFRRLKKCALSHMLNYNADGWFLRHGNHTFIYHPTWLWLVDFDLWIARKSNLRLRTRRRWFRQRRIEDPYNKIIRKCRKERLEKAQINDLLNSLPRVSSFLKMVDAAAKISEMAASYG